AVLDALLLVGVALDIGLHSLRRRRVRVARLSVVLLAGDIPAGAVLLAREPRFFRGRKRSVLHRARLVALDLRLLALELRSFSCGELARFEALLDPVLLVDVALHRSLLRQSCPG